MGTVKKMSDNNVEDNISLNGDECELIIHCSFIDVLRFKDTPGNLLKKEKQQMREEQIEDGH